MAVCRWDDLWSGVVRSLGWTEVANERAGYTNTRVSQDFFLVHLANRAHLEMQSRVVPQPPRVCAGQLHMQIWALGLLMSCAGIISYAECTGLRIREPPTQLLMPAARQEVQQAVTGTSAALNPKLQDYSLVRTTLLIVCQLDCST